MVVGLQLPAFGWTAEEESLWVPENGMGALLLLAVTDGAAEASCAELAEPCEFTLPPTASIDSQVPAVPEYVY